MFQINRERRLKNGKDYKTSLFSEAGFIFVSEDCSPPHQDLKVTK